MGDLEPVAEGVRYRSLRIEQPVEYAAAEGFAYSVRQDRGGEIVVVLHRPDGSTHESRFVNQSLDQFKGESI